MLQTTAAKLAVPTVHMNGTSQQELLDQLCNAFSAIGDAYDALKKAAPNGRDYYVQDCAGAYRLAADQHHARLQKLHDVQNELEQIADEIQKQER